MPSVAELLERESTSVDLEPGNFERLIRRRDRRRRNQRLAAGALALVMSLFVAAVLVRTLQSGRVPADRPIEPSPTAERVGFVGLPQEGAQASTPPGGELVISSHGLGPSGVHGDLYVYADGTMIWQKWADNPVPVGVPEGANEYVTGYLEQRLTTEGVELLRSRILSTGLFEHNLRLRAGSQELWIGVRQGDRVVFVSAFRPGAAFSWETPAQTRELERLEVLLADPAAWLPSTAWADPEIRAYVPSRYSGGFDRRVPSPSELPAPAAELLFERDDCEDFTIEQVRTISEALEDAGIPSSIAPDGRLAFEIPPGSLTSPGGSYLHFWPVLQDRNAFEGWDEGVPPAC